jgi:hypothetical protein
MFGRVITYILGLNMVNGVLNRVMGVGYKKISPGDEDELEGEREANYGTFEDEEKDQSQEPEIKK